MDHVLRRTLNRDEWVVLSVENMSEELVLLADEISDRFQDFYYRCQLNSTLFLLANEEMDNAIQD